MAAKANADLYSVGRRGAGLLGSTEWAETHADDLLKHAALYVNTDENGRGFFGAGGSQTLELLVNDVAKDITDPETHESVWKRQQAALLLRGGRRPNPARAGAAKEMLTRGTLPIEAIGSGSDFAAFIDHLGIVSLNLGYGGEDRSGTYHSAYDTPWFTDHFGDKDEVYGPILAQTAGTLVMRMADADILPYDFKIFAEAVKGYDTELKNLAKSLREDAETRKRNIDMGLYTLIEDPRSPMQAPGSLTPPPAMNFSALDESIAALEKAAGNFNQAEANIATLSPEKRRELNAELAVVERRLLSDQGLPRRPWVKHVLYAPGTYTGYGVKTIPGVREGLEQGRFEEAQEQVAVVAKAIQNEAAFIDQIAAGFTQ